MKRGDEKRGKREREMTTERGGEDEQRGRGRGRGGEQREELKDE